MVKTQELNYDIAEIPQSMVKMMPVYQNEGGNNVLLQLGNGPKSTFYSTYHGAYLDKSYLAFTLRIPPGAATPTYTWLQADGTPMINQIRVFLKSTGTELMNLTNFHKYANLVSRYLTCIDDVKSRDKLYAYAPVALTTKPPGQDEVLNCSNTAPDAVTPFSKCHDGTLQYTAFDEPIYLIRSQSGTAASALELDVLIKFDSIKDTFLEYDKLFYTGGQDVVFEVYWNGYNQMCWSSTSATDPSTGAAQFAPPDINPAAGPWGITNLRLMMATETNSEILSWAAHKYTSDGFTYKFRNAKGSKGPTSQSTTQSPEVRVTHGAGKRLDKVHWGCYNGTESANTMYDHSNLLGAKVQYYQAYLNDQLLVNGQYTIGSGTALTLCDDYNKEKEKLKGSCIQSKNEYYYNWKATVDFTRERPLTMECVVEVLPEENLLQGIVLGPYETKVNFVAQTSNSQFNHYLFYVVENELTVTPSLVRME